MKKGRIFTVGHSTHTIERFTSLLRRYGVTAVADVRSSPRSRINPQYNREVLKWSLREQGVEYVFLGDELGARPADRACYVNGEARYDLISKTEKFKSGLDRIREGSSRFDVALMCAEQDPITCHRTILVCRHLEEYDIRHILPNGSVEPHDDAMLRLVRELSGRNSIDSADAGLISAAYDVQAKTISYKESINRHDSGIIGELL
jgi:uncharacterized protein (DUF488 family)